jgi:hypothetical protein
LRFIVSGKQIACGHEKSEDRDEEGCRLRVRHVSVSIRDLYPEKFHTDET